MNQQFIDWLSDRKSGPKGAKRSWAHACMEFAFCRSQGAVLDESVDAAESQGSPQISRLGEVSLGCDHAILT